MGAFYKNEGYMTEGNIPLELPDEVTDCCLARLAEQSCKEEQKKGKEDIFLQDGATCA